MLGDVRQSGQTPEAYRVEVPTTWTRPTVSRCSRAHRAVSDPTLPAAAEGGAPRREPMLSPRHLLTRPWPSAFGEGQLADGTLCVEPWRLATFPLPRCPAASDDPKRAYCRALAPARTPIP